jgi:glycerate 2-kinase
LHRDARNLLLELWSAALVAVDGRACVRASLERTPLAGRCEVIAIGKAAAAMTLGALDALGRRATRALVVTKRGHVPRELRRRLPQATIIEAGHPVPDEQSLAAGEAVLAAVTAIPGDTLPLVLLSGGASSLAEALVPGVDLDFLARCNRWALAAGLDIAATNGLRRRLSRLKGGGLATALHGRPGRALMISDVPHDDPAVIGSGPLVATRLPPLPADLPDSLRRVIASLPLPPQPQRAPIDVEIVARPEDARDGAASAARRLGFEVEVTPTRFEGDAEALGESYARRLLASPAAVLVAAGESTVMLPAHPGRGGRNQQLALAAACHLARGPRAMLLAAGTDGTDGPTEDAGAIVDEGTLTRGSDAGLDARACLRGTDAGTFLEATGDLLSTGPTGTNVGDLLIGVSAQGMVELAARAPERADRNSGAGR